MPLAFPLLCILNALDAALTIHMVSLGRARELNPLFAPFLNRRRPMLFPFALYKALVPIALSYLAAYPLAFLCGALALLIPLLGNIRQWTRDS